MTDLCVKCGRPAGVQTERGEHNEIKQLLCLACYQAGWRWTEFVNRESFFLVNKNRLKGGKESLGKQIDVLA